MTNDPALRPEPPVFDASFADQFDTLLRWRRDVRHFDTRPLSGQDMNEILASAALSPSVGLSQPWRFVRVRSAATRAALVRHINAQNALAAQRYAGEARQAEYLALKLHGLQEAPEILAVFCDEQTPDGHGLGIATMPEMLRYSCVTAIHTIWLAARVRGIGVGWVSILDPAAITTLLDVPAYLSLIALLCVGYPAQASDTPELEERDWEKRQPHDQKIWER